MPPRITRFHFVPVANPRFSELPAQIDFPPFPPVGEVDEPAFDIFHQDAEAFDLLKKTLEREVVAKKQLASFFSSSIAVGLVGQGGRNFPLL